MGENVTGRTYDASPYIVEVLQASGLQTSFLLPLLLF